MVKLKVQYWKGKHSNNGIPPGNDRKNTIPYYDYNVILSQFMRLVNCLLPELKRLSITSEGQIFKTKAHGQLKIISARGLHKFQRKQIHLNKQDQYMIEYRARQSAVLSLSWVFWVHMPRGIRPWPESEKNSWMHIRSTTKATKHDNLKVFPNYPINTMEQVCDRCDSSNCQRHDLSVLFYRRTFHEWKITGNFQSPCQFR